MHSLQLENTDLWRDANFVGGAWTGSATHLTFDVANPATCSLVKSVPDSGATDAKNATDAAANAFPDWRETPARVRADILMRWYMKVEENASDLGRIISLEQGKPLAEAIGEVRYAASYIQWFAEAAAHVTGDIIAAPAPGKRMMALKEPVGVVAVVTPWNFPAAMIARKIAPALAVGCTVVGKPAEDTPLTALALARLAELAGVPKGVLNLVCASRTNTPEVVDAWLKDDRVRKISFTGSTAVGKTLAERSASTLKKLSLELGGNAPFIVFDDADLDAAADGLIAAKFRNAGQTCISPNRVLVQAGVYGKFAAKIVEKVERLTVGSADDPASIIGPLINQRGVEKVLAHIRNAIDGGAKLLTGGKHLGGNFVQPAVLGDVSADMLVCCEETFGPVVSMRRFDTEEEAIRLANNTPFGLAAYFYTENASRIIRLTQRLESGVIGANEGMVSAAPAPFGGVKESGYGREGSIHGMDDYVQLKYVCQGYSTTPA